MTARPPAAVVPATIGRRVAAYAIDVAIAYGIVAVLVGIAAAIIAGVGKEWSQTSLALLLLATWGVIALAALTWAIVYTAMQAGRGSIGQRTMRIRLYDTEPGDGDATAIGFGRALVRNIVWALATSIVVGYFTPLFDGSARRQGWHDKAARAIVGDRQATAAAVAPASEPPTSPITAAPAAPTAARPVVPPPPPRITSAPAASAGAPRATAAAATGMISHVPGITQDPLDIPARHSQSAPAPRTIAPVAPVAVVPAAASPSPAPARTAPTGAPAPVSAAMSAEDGDAPRAAAPVPPPAQRAALYPEAPVLAVLTWDDGSRMAVYGRTLYGRNPAPEEGTVSVAVRDETLSLSKTHFEIGGDQAHVWVVDRHSTNGTVLVRDGGRHTLPAGTRATLRVGDRLEFGDRSAAVGAGS